MSAFPITNAFVQQFSANIHILAQQLDSRFRGKSMEEPCVGDRVYFEQVDATVAQQIVSRHADTPLTLVPHKRRVAMPTPYNWSSLIDRIDKVRMLIDPQSSYAKDGTGALNRSFDDVFIQAALGTAYTGATGVTPVTMPSSQLVPANFVEPGAGSTVNSNLTIAKLRRARALFRANEVPEDEPLYMAISASQEEALLATSEVTSILTASTKAMVDGKIKFFMGFEFVHSERLAGAGTSALPRQCFAWSKKGMGVAVAEDIMARVSELPTKQYAVQVYLEQMMGASRVEEKRVVEIDCIES